MAFFQQAALTASICTDAIYGESMQIVPMEQGRLSGSLQDTGRALRAVTGLYSETPVDKQLLDQSPGMGRYFGSEIKGDTLTVSIQTSALFVDGVLTLPQVGDRFVRLDFPNARQLEITSVQPDGGARQICNVVKVEQ